MEADIKIIILYDWYSWFMTLWIAIESISCPPSRSSLRGGSCTCPCCRGPSSLPTSPPGWARCAGGCRASSGMWSWTRATLSPRQPPWHVELFREGTRATRGPVGPSHLITYFFVRLSQRQSTPLIVCGSKFTLIAITIKHFSDGPATLSHSQSSQWKLQMLSYLYAEQRLQYLAWFNSDVNYFFITRLCYYYIIIYSC